MKAKVLAVDNRGENLRFIEALLTVAGYEVVTASSGEEALHEVERESPDLVVLDATIPRIDGFEVCARLKSREETRLIPVVLITPENESKFKVRGFQAGVDDVLHRPIDNAEFLAMIECLVRAKHLNDELVSVENTLLALATAIEAKDPYTEGHVDRVAHYATSLAKEVGLPWAEQQLVRKAAILHDVGKIGVSDSILQKPGRLTKREFERVKIHPLVGERICQPLRQNGLILQVVRHHHERYDGRGYPDGLSGEEIPLAARIMAVVDTYDALTSDRPYRLHLAPEDALKVLKSEVGQQLDPRLTIAFISMAETGRLC